MNVEIREAQPGNLPAVLQLLKTVDLPTEGVSEHFTSFLVALDTPDTSLTNIQVIACVGLEVYLPSALLRSLAVHPTFQGQGLGKKMVDAASTWAKEHDVRQLFLLTDSAEDFFHKLGFNDINREQVPRNVRQSIEFTKLCPTAPCLTKKI
ncbi:MAG: arsenic resistance N-acetyltransferase ArsN2 [Candidatus Hermodarchaeia archaeon]|jgi:amino-acid N-acetyltransferase